MMLRKFVVPTLLIIALLVVACGPAQPATTAETAAEAPTATPTTAPAQEAATPTTAPAEAAAPATDEAVTYVVDVAASKVEWYGSKPIGASEAGTVNIAEGTLRFTGDQLVDGAITIDMTSIATTSQSGGMAEQLVGHLSSDDFFGVATYPTAQLVLKSAEPTGEANQYRVKADLTIKTTTKEIEFVATATEADGTLTGTAEIVVNRADFDVRYNSAAFFSNLGDNLISDDMELTVTLVAKKG